MGDVAPGPDRSKVWDLPVRLGHWLLAGLVGFSWFAAETRRMDWHRWSGYAVLAIVAFRIYWGLFGSSTARFSGFVKGPRETLRYASTVLKPHRAPGAGHNPLGALSVLALLGVLVAQVVSGLYAVDVDGIESGPLSDRVDFDLGRTFAHWHAVSFRMLQGLVVLHLLAILFYAVRKKANLVGPMLSGGATDEAVTAAPAWRAALGVAIASVLAWSVARGLRF